MEEELQAILSEFDGKQEEIIPILQKVYAQFRFTPTGKNIVSVCRGTACHVRGAPAILEETTAVLGLEGEGTTEDLEYTVETVACIGCCALAPCMTVNEEVHGNLNKKKVRTLLNAGGKSNDS